MSNIVHIKRSIFSSLLSGILALSFIVAPISMTFDKEKIVQRAEAVVMVEDMVNWVANYGSWIADAASAAYDAISSAASNYLALKESTLDGIAWALVNLLIKEMIKSTTKWVASGFQGSPAFVTDLKGFLLDLADKVAGDFIYGSNLQFLCSAFKLDIQIALELQYNKSRGDYQAKCRLSSVINNIENFLAGDFMSGGWEGWYDMTLTPGNNRFGAYMEAQAGLSVALTNEKGQQLEILKWGSGFLSQKDANGKIITPGNVIETQLNNALDMPGRRLAVADEINELIGTLFAQLVSSMLSSGKGIAGLNDASNGPSYFDQIDAQASQQGLIGGLNAFENDLSTVNTYIGHQNTIISLVTTARDYMATNYPACKSPAGALTPSLQNKLNTAQASLANANATVATINTYRSDYDALGSSATPEAVKNNLMAKYTASSASEAQANLLSSYTTFASASVPSINQNVTLETTTVRETQTEVTQFTQAVDRACP